MYTNPSIHNIDICSCCTHIYLFIIVGMSLRSSSLCHSHDMFVWTAHFTMLYSVWETCTWVYDCYSWRHDCCRELQQSLQQTAWLQLSQWTTSPQTSTSRTSGRRSQRGVLWDTSLSSLRLDCVCVCVCENCMPLGLPQKLFPAKVVGHP